jgi:hypothetical protein
MRSAGPGPRRRAVLTRGARRSQLLRRCLAAARAMPASASRTLTRPPVVTLRPGSPGRPPASPPAHPRTANRSNEHCLGACNAIPGIIVSGEPKIPRTAVRRLEAGNTLAYKRDRATRSPALLGNVYLGGRAKQQDARMLAGVCSPAQSRLSVRRPSFPRPLRRLSRKFAGSTRRSALRGLGHCFELLKNFIGDVPITLRRGKFGPSLPKLAEAQWVYEWRDVTYLYSESLDALVKVEVKGPFTYARRGPELSP